MKLRDASLQNVTLFKPTKEQKRNLKRSHVLAVSTLFSQIQSKHIDKEQLIATIKEDDQKDTYLLSGVKLKQKSK